MSHDVCFSHHDLLGDLHQRQQEDVWDLLLDKLWSTLDQAVVCKMLCCSQTMANLVHSKCAGRLRVCMSSFGAPCSSDTNSSSTVSTPHPSWPQHHALGRWLAKHARLCSSIDVSITPDSLSAGEHRSLSTFGGLDPQAACSVLEASIAAGLAVAARGPSAVDQVQLTTQDPAVLWASSPETIAAAAAASDAAAAAVVAARNSGTKGCSSGGFLRPAGAATAAVPESSSICSGVAQLCLPHALPFGRASALLPTGAAGGVFPDAVSSGSNDQHSHQEQQKGRLQLQQQQQQQQQGLQLQLASLCSSLPSGGRMLLGLAGLAQLTSLQLTLGNNTPADGCSAALATLTAMRSLTLHVDAGDAPTALTAPTSPTAATGPRAAGWGPGWSSGPTDRLCATLQPALQHLTNLTNLSLGWTPDSLAFSTFPTSLISLHFGKEYGSSGWHGSMHSHSRVVSQLQHLTCLTQLEVRELEVRTKVPPSIRLLKVDHLQYLCGPDGSLTQLQHLQHLQHLHLQQSCRLNEVRMLQQLTQLTHLGVVCKILRRVTDGRDIKLPALLPTLPLKWLRLHGASFRSNCLQQTSGEGSILAALGSCTQLTHLQLESVRVGCSVVRLCEQLRKLPALQELQLVSLEAPKPVGTGVGVDGGVDVDGGGGDDGGGASGGAGAGVDPRDAGQGSAGSFWGPLWRDVALLAPLRRLVVELMPLQDGDVSALASASQLTCLKLVGCGVSQAGAAQLKSVFEHMRPQSMLSIG